MPEEFISRQICKFQTSKKLIEFKENLNVADVNAYAHIHAGGEKCEAKDRKYSRISLTILDYSNGTGEGKSISASFNLKADEIRRLLAESYLAPFRRTVYEQVEPAKAALASLDAKLSLLLKMVNHANPSAKKETIDAMTQPIAFPNADPAFNFTQEKIIATQKDAEGRSPVSKLSIQRKALDNKGQPMGRPWYISIEEGSAVAVTNANGGSSAGKGTYQRNQSVFVLLTDAELQQLLTSAVAYINVWETGTAIPVVKKAREQIEAQRTAQKTA